MTIQGMATKGAGKGVTTGVTTSFLNTSSLTGGTFKKLGLIGATCLFLVGCDSMWPSLEAQDPAGSNTPTASAAPASTAPAPSSTAQTSSAPSSTATAPTPSSTLYSSTTAVGERINQMDSDLGQLTSTVTDLKRRLEEIRGSGAASATAYHSYKAEITSRLQLGTTPGNPVLVEQWNAAQSSLSNVEQAIPALTALHNDCADQAAFGKFLLSTVQATYGLSGAVDEDHRRLRTLEDAVHQSLVDLDRMLTSVTQEINRHNLYVSNERQNMTTLALGIKNGELYGTNIASRSFALVEAAAASAAASGPAPGGDPLVIIRFDRENVQYQQALYNAVSQALTAKPDAVFDLVAVSPDRGNAAQVALNGSAARRNAEDVLRTLTDMGVQPGRINLMADSQNVGQNEVHLYVR